MTNAEKLARDTDRLADLILQADALDEACSCKWDEKSKEYINCQHGDIPNGCRICVKEWLAKEAVK